MSEATLFTAYAIQSSRSWLQVEIKNDKTGFNLFVGSNLTYWSDYTEDFYSNETSFSYITDEVRLTRDNNTLIASFAETGNTLIKCMLAIE